MNRWKRFGLLALAALAVSVIAGWWVYVRPWTVMPGPREKLDREWGEVEGWAALSSSGGGPSFEALRLAIDAAGHDREALQPLLKKGGKDSLERVARESLPEKTRAALSALDAWNAAGASFPHSCPEGDGLGHLTPLAGMSLVRASLASAGSPEEAAPALALARELRRHGSLLEAMVGLTLGSDALATAKDRGWSRDSLAAFRPSAGDAFPTLARELVCGQRQFEAMLAGKDRKVLFDDNAPFVMHFISIDREILVTRTWFSDQLHRGEPHRGDLTLLAADLRIASPDDLPKSFLLRLVASDNSRHIDKYREKVAEWDAWLSQKP